jgi:hypothetical protein
MSSARTNMQRARTAASPLAQKLGITAFNLQMLKSVRRTAWLYGARGRIPAAHIRKRPAAAVTDADRELCQRLIAAYGAVGTHDSVAAATEGMWSWIFDTRQHELAQALERGDPGQLAALLSTMFQSDFVLGMAPGSLITHAQSPLGARIWALKCLDGLVSLAETLAVVPVENPEQGGTGLAFDDGAAELFSRLERALGFRLDFPEVGAAAGVEIAGRVITPDTPDQVYGAVRVDQAIGLHLEASEGARTSLGLVEIGGGYGGMCHWFMKLRGTGVRYTIVDLPIVGVLQGYFLGRSLGPERVSLHGEPAAEVCIAPNVALDAVEVPFEVLVNKDSMPEMPRTAMIDYLRWGASNCSGLFYSYNQEAAAEFRGEVQGVVHEGAAEVGGWRRVRRDESWVRRGYVEEIYVPYREARARSATAVQ